MGGILIVNHRRQEYTVVQQYPLKSAFFAELGWMATSSKSSTSEQSFLFDVTCLGCFIGPWVSEYAQTSPNLGNYHGYLSGKQVIKALTANDISYYDKAGNIIKHLDNNTTDIVSKVKITWRIQKNLQNGQSKTLLAKPVCPQLNTHLNHNQDGPQSPLSQPA